MESSELNLSGLFDKIKPEIVFTESINYPKLCDFIALKLSNLIPSVFSAHFDYLSFFSFSVNCDFSTVSELRRLNSQLEELKSDLKDRDEEIKSLKEQLDSQNKHPVSN